MNKKIKFLTGLLIVASLPTTVFAENWVLPDTGTEIEGRLYKVSGSKATAEASTKNVTQNKYKVYVQVYAKDGSNVVNSSVSTKSANSFVSTRSTYTAGNRWESLHSTTPSNDPYKSLRLYKIV